MNDAALEALWKHVVDHWDDEAAHRAFLEHCRHADVLVEAAVRYRGMKGDRERSAVAEKKLQAIAVLALAKLESMRTPERPERARVVGYLLVGAFLAGTLGLLAYLNSFH